ncbi:MAG TPA: PKD domain-containing protein, partial [Bacteroidales bacterium]|nr:PKD domain-containing protein [Bacteroidales bacterium]
LTVKYTNQSGPGKFTVSYDYKWEYGDGGTSTTKDVTHSHTFENKTSKELPRETRLIATSMYKCTDTAKIDIKVYPFIDADLWFKDPEGCSPYNLILNNSSLGGANGFVWLFENGNVASNAPLLSHTFRNLSSKPQPFYPKLVASYNGQCQDTATEEVLVYPEVTAQFTQDTLKGCHPLTINITNQSKNGDYFFWYYGDKGKSRDYHTSHTYNDFANVDSVYNLRLDVESMFGCKKSITKQVTVYPKPKPIIEILKSEDCPPFNVTITNKSEAGDFYNWEFGDGDQLMTTNLLPVSHPYDNTTDKDAIYDLKLTVMSVHNCTSVTTQPITVFPRVEADFTPDTVGCGPLTVLFKNKSVRATTYDWAFGNTFTSKLKDGSSKFENKSLYDTTFHVRMIGYSNHGCSDTAYRDVTVYPQPLAGFNAAPIPLFYPDARLNIDNQTNDGIWSYLWEFGDGQKSDLAEPGSHEYMHWGIYNLKLKAWNIHCKDSVSKNIPVKAPNTIADFDASDNGCVPLTMNFTNHSTWATSYKWDFDDGGTSTDIHASHVYNTPGKYQVKLITYGDGAKDETTRDIEVYPKPEVKFNLSPRAPEEVMLPDALVQFYNTSKLGDRYRWDFGDGDTSSVFEPTHTYQELGIYDVSLNVWTEHLCFDSVTLQDAVIVQGKGLLVFPNAFTPGTNGPNGGEYKLEDKRNDIFYPYHDGVEEYKLEIYDRWGELLFESDKVNVGWDGYYKGNLCKSDVYIWKAKGKFYNGSSFNKAGDVTLLR